MAIRGEYDPVHCTVCGQRLDYSYDLPSPRYITVQTERVPDPNAGKVVHINVTKVSDNEA
jgi:hypothetical protein